MLLPDSRTVAFDLIRPPSGYRLDFAVLTTYTLDLEALLVLPLSLLAHADGGLEELLADPLRLHQAIRDAGDRVHAFVDETGIAIPRGARPLYSMLESSVHAVRAPERRQLPSQGVGGPVHCRCGRRGGCGGRSAARLVAGGHPVPKPDLRPLLGRRIGERGVAPGRQAARGGEPAAGRLPVGAAATGHDPDWINDIAARVQALADQVARAAFPAPDGFDSPIAFHALGLSRSRRTWQPPSNGYSALAIAPFVNRTGLDAVGRLSDSERILVSRQEELDKLSEDALADWNEVSSWPTRRRTKRRTRMRPSTG